MSAGRRLVLTLLALAAPAVVGGRLCAQEAEEHVSLDYGRRALAAGEHEEAAGHFLYALARSRTPVTVAALLLENAAAAGDVDAQTLWALDWAALAADAKGRARTGPVADFLPAGEVDVFALTAARATAVADLLKARDKWRKSKRVGAGIAAEWAEDLARRLAAPLPALAAATADEVDPAVAVDKKRMKAVVSALAKAVRQAVGANDKETVVRAARCLRGLGAQEDFDTGYGPDPVPVGPSAREALAALQRLRDAIEESGLRIWLVPELEDMDEDEARAFTLEHASFANPGLALSPQGWYRVETNCGHGTLLGAAETVEFHHRRLVGWFGEDPFVGRPGILRVVPESHGLEMEGSPFWWAGGFQGGDVTTLKFTLGTIPGLGRGITHELTHRFDGAIYGGLPGWLAEGRAVWTGANYGLIEDTEFVDDHVSFGTMTNTSRMGYGRLAKLEELIDGSLEEYRDNYTAGYALFVYLRSWSGVEEGGSPWYAERLEEYMRSPKRGKGDPVEVFAEFFADGEDGRPDGMEAFADDWRAFIQGFYWREPAPWTKRYDPRGPRGEQSEVVYDEPTFSWLRARAEPWFGQDQARVAGELFAGLDQEDDAVEALHWSLAVDEPSDATLELLEEQLLKAGNQEAAWIVSRWLRYASPPRSGRALPPAPFVKQLGGVTALLELQATAARTAVAAGLPRTAAALAAEHDALAWDLGLDPLCDPGLPDADALAAAPGAALHPFDPPARLMDLGDWTEEGLTGVEDRRVEGLWFVEEDGDLQVGRREARGGTDTMDRRAIWRDAFVLSTDWQDPGRYVLRTKIELTTSFLSGGVVLGWTRRDRAVRFSFSAGDWQFSMGEREDRRDVGSVAWRLSGAYARGKAVSRSTPFRADDASTFDLELRVDGPTVEVWLEGRYIDSWTTLDARPIAGRIGFWTDNGAMRVVTPEVQRLDRSAWAPNRGALGRGLSPTLAGETEWKDLIGLPTSDLPLTPSGTVILWFSEQTAEKQEEMAEGDWAEHVISRTARFVDAFLAEDASQGLLVVVPESFPMSGRRALREEFTEDFPDLLLATHTRGVEIGEEGGWTVGGWTPTMLAFADPAGILRYARRMQSNLYQVPRELNKVLLEYRDHVRPGQAGAAE